MPKNTNILLIRHGEKPPTGSILSADGQLRAEAYVGYFQKYSLRSTATAPLGSDFKLHHLFAAACSQESHRPCLTLEPLAAALSKPPPPKPPPPKHIHHQYKDKDYEKLAAEILSNSQYENTNILICWHHGEILKLAGKLGVDPSKLPAASNWPSEPWPPEVFGWLLQICYDGNGKIIHDQTLCFNENLMPDDHGQNPPDCS